MILLPQFLAALDIRVRSPSALNLGADKNVQCSRDLKRHLPRGRWKEWTGVGISDAIPLGLGAFHGATGDATPFGVGVLFGAITRGSARRATPG